MRFVIGLYALIALAVLLGLTACGSDDEDRDTTPTSSPSAVVDLSPSVASKDESDCFRTILLQAQGEVVLLGHVEAVSESGPQTAPGFEHQLLNVEVTFAAPGDPGPIDREIDPRYAPGESVGIVLLADLITDVEIGDCIGAAGQEQRWACGSDCEDFGFVVSFVEVREKE